MAKGTAREADSAARTETDNFVDANETGFAIDCNKKYRAEPKKERFTAFFFNYSFRRKGAIIKTIIS